MSPAPPPPEIVARALPRWMELADASLAAAQDSAAEPARLHALAEAASGAVRDRPGWPSVFGRARDDYVGAALLWTAKAFCRQDSAALRATLADVLLEAALAFKARLARAAARLQAEAPAPILPLRRLRRDIDDMPDEISDAAPEGEG